MKKELVMNKKSLILLIPFLAAAGPCQQPKDDDALTVQEAKTALDEAALSAKADALISGTVEISTNFTIGQAVEAAAEELKTFIETQLPCAEITLEDATLTIVYGALKGNCTYNGHTYSGAHAITVTSAAAGNLIVNHEWTDISSGEVSVTGTATVTWSAETASRNVQHTLTWTRLSDNKKMTGSGNRTQTLLEGGILEGIEVDGTRHWSGDSGEWNLDIDKVQIQWTDPVPQSGSYAIDTPYDKSLSMTFNRKDEDTITVTIASGDKSFNLDISKSGTISE
jgi:hypothetical protein